MHAFLFTGATSESRTEEIGNFLRKKNIPAHNRVYLEPSGEKASIGIADVRAFIHTLSLTSSDGNMTSGIIPDASLLTEEAQSALLKTVEEPPAHAIICISTTSDSVLLSTIVSRCQICPVHESKPSTKSESDSRVLSVIRELTAVSRGQRIEIIEKNTGPTRKDCIDWIDRAITELSLDPVSYSVLLHKLLEAKSLAANNVNPFHLLERIFLSLEQ